MCTLLYCEHRTEAAEMATIAKQLSLKYGAEFAARAASNTGGCVNERVVHKLSVQPPSSYLVQQVKKRASGFVPFIFYSSKKNKSSEKSSASIAHLGIRAFRSQESFYCTCCRHISGTFTDAYFLFHFLLLSLYLPSPISTWWRLPPSTTWPGSPLT